MTYLVGYSLLFLGVAVFFVFIHLLIGKLVRPIKPDPDKLTIYECGEPTIGSAWIQFDLRFYVVALLFVIFDVEVAFFFPWAVVFGKANTLARAEVQADDAWQKQYKQQVRDFVPPLPENGRALRPFQADAPPVTATETGPVAEAARSFGWLAFFDLLVFFGVLLVGFAYLWRRGDLDWVRSTLAERMAAPASAEAPAAERELVGAGRG